MAVYKSKYAELTFYADGEAHSFKDGKFHTEDKVVIAVLDKLVDVEKEAEAKPKEQPKDETPAKSKKGSAKK